jgi:hypothetical protein
MSAGQHLSDFVGYEVGKPTTVPAEVGMFLSDFVGYKVGRPTAVAPVAGFVGLLDFTGIPVGVPAYVPPTPVFTTRMGTGQVPIIDYGRIKRYRDDDDIIIVLK